MLGPCVGVLFQPDGLDLDESRSVFGAEVVQRIHGRLLFGVQVLGAAGTTKDVYISLVAPQANFTVNGLLAENQGVLNERAFGREVSAIVQVGAPVVSDKLIPKRPHLGVENQALEVKVGKTENGDSG